MKKILCSLLFISMIFTALAQAPFQTRNTAITLEKGTFEFSAFACSRWGCGNKTELFTNPAADWQLPHAGIKHLWYVKKAQHQGGWFSKRNFYFSTRHIVDYPTMFFNSVQKHKDWINDSITVPGILTMSNEIRVSTFLKAETSCSKPDFLFTLRGGLKNSFNFKDSDFMPVQRKLWYRETVVCCDTVVWFVGADIDFSITDRLNLSADVDFYSVDWNVDDFSIENKIFVYGYFGMRHRLMAQAGIKTGYETFDGDHCFFILPMIDVSFFLKPKSGRQKGLFGDNM